MCIQDELLWAAAWLYQATNNQYYLNYLGNNGDSMGGTGWSMTEFSWDVKYAGVQTLVAKVNRLIKRNNIGYLCFYVTCQYGIMLVSYLCPQVYCVCQKPQ